MLQASRAASLGEDAVRTRAAAISAVALLAEPPDLPWLCLQPAMQPLERTLSAADGSRVTLRWWHVGAGTMRVEVAARGPLGGRHRRVGWMRPDSLAAVGCPGATRLLPAAEGWMGPHPEG